jgi:hypothetical protein
MREKRLFLQAQRAPHAEVAAYQYDRSAAIWGASPCMGLLGALSRNATLLNSPVCADYSFAILLIFILSVLSRKFSEEMTFFFV